MVKVGSLNYFLKLKYWSGYFIGEGTYYFFFFATFDSKYKEPISC